MPNDRPKLGFADELESFNPDTWAPKPSPHTTKIDPTEAAHAAGFRSREPNIPTEKAAPKPRRRRTGRNTQFNIKADPAVIDRFVAIADANGWVFGEAFEYAVDLLEKQSD